MAFRLMVTACCGAEEKIQGRGLQAANRPGSGGGAGLPGGALQSPCERSNLPGDRLVSGAATIPVPQVFTPMIGGIGGLEDRVLRVTFDIDLRWRDTALDLRSGDGGERITSRDQILMEIKIPVQRRYG